VPFPTFRIAGTEIAFPVCIFISPLFYLNFLDFSNF